MNRPDEEGLPHPRSARSVRVDRVSADLPALEMAQLARLAGATLDEHRQTRAMVLSFAESYQNEQYVASVWDGDALEGIAAAFVGERPDGSPLLRVWFPAIFRREGASPFFYADPADAARVTRELLEALVEHARSLRAAFVMVPYCPASDHAIAEAAAALAFRTVPAETAYVIQLEEPTSFETYLGRLSQTRRGEFRRDLRRAAKAGARMVDEAVARPETLALAWPLQVALAARKGGVHLPGTTSLFDALQRRLDPGELRAEACFVGDELAGAMVMQISGTVMNPGYMCHRPDLDWQVYMAILASSIERAIARGMTRIHLGFGNDYQKTRLGADALPHVGYVLSLRRP